MVSEQTALVGFEDLAVVEAGRGQAEVEAWLAALEPAGESQTRLSEIDGGKLVARRADENEGRFFAESYLALRAQGWAWREALCVAWLSLGRDDRGELRTVQDLCDFLGVSRMWFYERKARYDGEPAPGMNAWDWWAERLQLGRLRGQRLAEVDEATFRRAASSEGKAADRELYYKRAGVLGADMNVQVAVGQQVDVSQLSDSELDALLAAEGKAIPLPQGNDEDTVDGD